MNHTIDWKVNTMQKCKSGTTTQFLSCEEINKARQFHQSFPQYQPTPLRSLNCLAQRLGVAGVYVKDESYRFGLNAFKVLGGSYAIARYLAKRLGADISELPYSTLISPAVKKQLGDITFATTTDGNHGRGVAWTARQLQQKAIVYMPKGSSIQRLENIQAEGAEACITELNYDDAVRMTDEHAKKHGWIVVQDTVWEGYEEIPTWIMQGYGTMAAEAVEQLRTMGIERPSHVMLQAGVGSLAGAVQGYLKEVYGEQSPAVAIVESDQAACLYKSALAEDGKPYNVGGHMDTIMAGLACGEPNLIAWDVLRDYSSLFFACPDWVAARGMRILGNPAGADSRIVSGESGAVTMGLLSMLLSDGRWEEAKAAFGLNADSTILLFSTEGDTDPEKYRSIVWDGEYPSFSHL